MGCFPPQPGSSSLRKGRRSDLHAKYPYYQNIHAIQLGKVSYEKSLLPLIPYIPKLTLQVPGDWRSRILQAFTEVFRNCDPESSMKLACISAIEEMLAPERGWLYLDAVDPMLLDYWIAWIQDLPSLLVLLDDKSPLCSKAVLRLQLHVGKVAPVNSRFGQEYDNMQYKFRDFFITQSENASCYGPFIKLSADIQELAICCLYYFSFVDSLLLHSLVSCCLCGDLDPCLVFRILEVLHSAFRAGHIQVADYTSFHVTLLSRFQIYPGKVPALVYDGKSNRKTFKSITSIVCSYLSQIGDTHLIFEMLDKIIIENICEEIPMDNKCAFLRLLVKLVSKPTRISDQSTLKISHVLPQYLIDVIYNVKEDDCDSMSAISVKRRQYYLLPCFYLFHGCKRLLNMVLSAMGSWVSEVSSSPSSNCHPSIDRSTRICAIVSVLLHMNRDAKIQKVLLSCKIEMEKILQKLLNLLSSEGTNLTLEERHKIRSAHDRLRDIIND